MDKIFGSWWPWGRQESYAQTILSSLPPLNVTTTSATPIVSSVTAAIASSSLSSSSSSPSTTTQQFIANTTTAASTTISTVFTTFIHNQHNYENIFNNETANTSATINATILPTESLQLFGNESILVQLQSIDFPEDELFFAGMMMWNNNSSSTIDFQLEHNGTNVTNATTKLDFETTWHLLSTVLTAVLLGVVILATVIGE